MSTWLVTHPACLEHDTGAGHPESAARLRAILSALETSTFEYLLREEAPCATPEQLEGAHDPDYVRAILESVPETGCRHIDSDTLLSPGTGEAALRAAGGVCHAVDGVLQDQAHRAFCAVRPPGHHAESDRAMGFCFFNNVAVGAAHASMHYGLRRIAMVDFDVHHGNGTEEISRGRPRFHYFSTHQHPLFPGTGLPSAETPRNIVNAALADGDGSERFQAVFNDTILPAVDAVKPELILISAGFDAHRADPLATLRLDESDFAWATRELVALARRHCNGRLVSVLEGGYNLSSVGRCAAAHVEALMM
ncbi:acetoin utilization protein [Halorhodospira abdelmalekii]|uniref:histone deacetylase family protein n=1 Tax=Halorhodospira abdelmalekii TaxID=421629 RepID=UPI001905554D|nr:histone deacetylase family protein [Halorhodospira abdelmalekii]MBK1735278.1 acetoin utilization protein [Halorhodospira abdelmalekii]